MKMRNGLRLVLVALLGVACLVATGCNATTRGVVAADHPLASEAGAEMLRKGGNAVDAAVATSFALSVVRPESCGIGGGGFMMIHIAAGDEHAGDYAINYRETCPAGIGPETYEQWNDPEASRFGGRAVGIPGTVAGLLLALDRFGSLDRSVVLAPAIRYAQDGFRVDRHHVESAEHASALIMKNGGWEDRFGFVYSRFAAEGRIRAGDLVRNPEQAEVLRRIARDGAQGFYEGATARSIVDAVRADGGVLTLEDLAGYEPRLLEPLRIEVEGATLLTMPPPSSGGTAIGQFFGLLDRVGVLGTRIDPGGWYDPETAHLVVEAFKHAFADRAEYMADAAFVDVPIGRLLSGPYLDERASRIDPARTQQPKDYGTRRPPPDDSGTSHFCVADRWGNVVSCTETINLGFGSLLVAPELGFCLNNEMDDFTTRRGEPNAFGLTQSDDNLPAPGKRPLSSMSPTIVLNRSGEAVAASGASGGPRIISATAQSLLRVLAWDATAAQAVGGARLHHQWMPDEVILENRETGSRRDALVRALRAKGHTIGSPRDIAAVQLIRRDPNGAWDAASDPRKGGKPAYE